MTSIIVSSKFRVAICRNLGRGARFRVTFRGGRARVQRTLRLARARSLEDNTLSLATGYSTGTRRGWVWWEGEPIAKRPNLISSRPAAPLSRARHNNNDNSNNK